MSYLDDQAIVYFLRKEKQWKNMTTILTCRQVQKQKKDKNLHLRNDYSTNIYKISKNRLTISSNEE